MRRSFVIFLLWISVIVQGEDFSKTERTVVISELERRLKPVMGKEWDVIRNRFDPQLTAAKTKSEFYAVIRKMFLATKKSHFLILPPSAAKLDARRGGSFGQSGLVCSLVGDVMKVVSVASDSPAGKAGMTPGFEIDFLDGVSMKAVIASIKAATTDTYRRRVSAGRRINYWLRGAAGAKRTLIGRDVAGKSTTYVLILKRPQGSYAKQGHLGEEWLEFESKRLANGTVGYVRFNVFMMPLLPKIRKAIESFASCKAIIVDLRGNPGGLGMMAIPVAGMFMNERASLGETRSGKDIFRYPVFPTKNPYRGELVILTNELTASTSEILAAGLQEHGRATVVGTRTMGAVLPSLIIKLENGGIIQYPIGDFKTPKGTLLEGRGVTPDVAVVFDENTLKKSNDPILAHALEMIAKQGTEK